MKLGLSIVSLDLLETLITTLSPKIEKNIKDIKVQWLDNETNLVKHELTTHMNDIKLKIRMILKSKYDIIFNKKLKLKAW